MPQNDQIKEIAKMCRKSVTFFVENFCKIKHPTIGILPFKLFSYQKNCLKEFRENRFNVFKKCRQSGISTLCGAYALWLSMFFNDKTILVVSKTDEDAKVFLNRNIKFLYNNLPAWMREVWDTPINNEHQLGFRNGSLIRSLTSAPNTLRSNASSLNIIDEAAFIADMESMWAGGYSTMQHGGHAIIVSTPNGIGNWYWKTWVDAVEGKNNFNDIEIEWYKMDWALTYKDPITNRRMRIAPIDNLRKCDTPEEIEKYGEYWSPWLEGEYKGLQQKGKGHLFKQEILAEFLGSGGTVLGAPAIRQIQKRVENSVEPQVISTIQTYIHPITGETEHISFNGPGDDEGMYVWEPPVVPIPDVRRNNRITKKGKPGHVYVLGVDVATGKNDDYSTIQVVDVDTMEQVAEFMGRPTCIPFAKIVDFVGRWYNNALAVVENTGIGNPFIQNLEALCYPNLWRKKVKTRGGVSYGPIGFPTSTAGKATLNKNLIDNLSEEDGMGYTVHSERLFMQCQTYIRKRNKAGMDTGKTEAQGGNHDDLVMSLALAFNGLKDAVRDYHLLPVMTSKLIAPTLTNVISPQLDMQQRVDAQSSALRTNDPACIMPFSASQLDKQFLSQEEEIARFSQQIANGITANKVSVVKRDYFNYKR